MRYSVPLLAVAVAASACGGRPQPAPRPLAPFAGDSEILAAGGLITPQKVHDRIGVIADDSMQGRNTPSRGLEETAAYLAASYQRWGLIPLGDSGTYIQRYRIERVRARADASWLEVTQDGVTQRFPLNEWASVRGPMTGQPITGPARLISGAVTTADIAPLPLAGTMVFFVQSPDRAPANQQVLRALALKAPAAIVVLQGLPPDVVRARVADEQRHGNPSPVVVGVPPSGVPTVLAADQLLEGLADHPDFDAMRRSTAPVIMDVPSGVTVSLQLTPEVVSTATAPNVVAVMPGSDSALQHEYVVFSAHMDHVGRAGDGVGGCTAAGADSICNGADDDGSGTTGILSIAEAVAKLHSRTRRSILFLNVSGEEKGLLGSAYFTAHPTVALDHVVADINMDMIGRNNPDSIVVIGKEHSDLGTTLAGVQAAHPELHLTAADDIWPEQNFYARSDHFNFARKGVPILFFFNGLHPQYHRPGDEVALIDSDKLARVAQLGFYFGVKLADTMPRPQWNPASYQKIVVQQQVP